jgi:polyketide biosynthesis enoyl-CoA hydratase PksH
VSYQTIKTRVDGPVYYLQLHRPEANNTINAEMIAECSEFLEQCEASASVVVLAGLPEVFCFGADFQRIRNDVASATQPRSSAEDLYALWERIANGSFVSVAHVRGQANAGGVGFVAASDIVIADPTARFSLSELLFGLYPACVMPFLARRIGLQKANYMTLTTQAVPVEQAQAWGLVDAFNANSEGLLQRQLMRLRHLSKPSVGHYKKYMSELGAVSVAGVRELAVRNNREMHLLPGVMEGIVRYVDTGRFPWERGG